MNFRPLKRLIEQQHTFLLSAHVNPDMDALSSELVLAAYLRSCGKKVRIVNHDPTPQMYDFLPGVRRIKLRRDVAVSDGEAAIILDCGDLNRVGSVKELLGKGQPLVNLDHHVTNDGFGTINLICPQASSTAEVIYDFLKEMRFSFTKPLAELLYMGIMTDTGSFRYDSTRAHTHEVVGHLLRFGFSVSRIYKKIYETVSSEDMETFIKIIANVEMLQSGKVAVVELPRAFVASTSGSFDLKDKVFSFLRALKDLELIAILVPQENRSVKVSFRSRERVDVALLAARYGGGGHQRASGCTLRGNLADIKRIICRDMEKMVKG